MRTRLNDEAWRFDPMEPYLNSPTPADLVASLRATSDADEAERFRAMLFGEAL